MRKFWRWVFDACLWFSVVETSMVMLAGAAMVSHEHAWAFFLLLVSAPFGVARNMTYRRP